MRLIILPLLLLLPGCTAAEDWFDRARHASLPPLNGPEQEDPNAPQRLLGEYRVAGIDGQPLDANFGIGVSVDAETISYEPRCAGFVWKYHYRAGWLATQRSSSLRTQPEDAAEAGACANVAPELTQLASAIDAAERAERTPENGILLSGGGRSVTLFSQ